VKKKIALLQFRVAFSDRLQNMRIVEEMFRQYITKDIDFVCLPETWDLGFYPTENLYELADESGGQTKAFLSRLAAAYGVNIVGGSVIERHGGVLSNAAYVFDRVGNAIARYVKMHGAVTIDDHTKIESGNEVVTFELDGVTCGVLICYDLRFPELARAIALRGAQLLFVPTQWPKERIDHWHILTKARALENLFYLAGANASGGGGGVVIGCGYSTIIDPWGTVAACCGEEETAAVIGEADFGRVSELRSRIRVFGDRKPDVYKL
jgi:predicted amidohydrolase